MSFLPTVERNWPEARMRCPMAPTHCKLLNALCLVACLLTGAASGDDFCFARLLFDVPFVAADPLPLDDPNTDFVAQAKSIDGGGPALCPPPAVRPTRASQSLPLDVAHADGPHVPPPESNTPLLC
jgi:hypothetical protein